MDKQIDVLAIVQARLGSTRFPGKVMREICGTPLIGFLLKRLALAKQIQQIVLATSSNPKDDELADYVYTLGIPVFRGSESDLLDRYYQAALRYRPKAVVRVTGDCPLIDPQVTDEVIQYFHHSKVDYVSNILLPTYPDGLDVEIFTFASLEKSWQEATTPHQREHVTPFLRESEQFTRKNWQASQDYSKERWTVDEPADLEVIQSIVEHFHPEYRFTWQEVLALKKIKSTLFEANASIPRNQGASMGTGQKLWKRAKQIIPGGNMLLSKRSEMFLPENWPAYFSRAKGCYVWDLDGNQYIDMCIMGIGTNILGYGHPEVDQAVTSVIDSGNMATFNCPEEVYLAEKLVELHPWADMVRLARTGGEANALAIRIARTASGKSKVAFCGYHGWHDWYLAANLADRKNLDPHLLAGLEPNGVPEDLQGTVLPFNYNRFDELEALVQQHDIGVIKMEVARGQAPENGFLEKVRQLASERNIVLIFDECTSGFRQTMGGLHKLYGVEPDMAVFGKALGNGYAITAVIGRRAVMEYGQHTFISSTFWTERIGPAAGLKTLEVMAKIRSYEQISLTGRQIEQIWIQLAQKHGLKLHTFGLPSLIHFSIDSPNWISYKTLITQEMLKKGFLAANSVYVCIDHTPEILLAYQEAIDPIFQWIGECEKGQREVAALLDGPVCQSGLRLKKPEPLKS